MARQLKLSLGQHSDRGRKAVNQDFYGALLPGEPLLSAKGVTLAIADGISSSSVSCYAAQAAIKAVLTDYYCTSDTWPVKTSASRVIAATNAWLHAQTRRSQFAYDADKGYVCTFTAMIVKAATAHIFHVGDCRVYRVAGAAALEQLTEDHSVVVSSKERYLGRALGTAPQVEIDYRSVAVAAGDVFVMATDGVYEHVSAAFVARAVAEYAGDLDAAARGIVAEAMANGSTDNLTIQIVRVDATADGAAGEAITGAAALPLPPLLEPRQVFDGYTILREIHASSRSHIYLATDGESGERVALKIPSIDLRDDPAYLRRFMMEDWIARRVDNAHVLKAAAVSRPRAYLYTVMQFIEGQTLAQWMADHPRPDLEAVRGIVEQIAKGLRAFHRLEMLHQDLRPQNVMIDKAGTVTIIDFGSVKVPGVNEAAPSPDDGAILGTHQYTAPEYFLGEAGSTRSDIYALGVIAYQMLTGSLPYGARMAQARTRAQQRKAAYVPAGSLNAKVPAWVDGALRRAVHANPLERYAALSEFTHDLRHPRSEFLTAASQPLLQRNPLLFWQLLSLFLAGTVILLLALD